jgi:RimJ/RimL family protein N-acetyltransferase
MDNIKIRQANTGDAENLLNFFRKVGSETDFLTFDGNGVGMKTEQEVEHLKQYDNLKYGFYLVATDEDGNIVGQSAITQDYPKSASSSHIYSLGICILKDYWGMGIASRMMEKLIDHAKDIGVIRLDLFVVTANDRAIKLYKKFGFKIEGTLRKCHKIDNEYEDEYIMALIF